MRHERDRSLQLRRKQALGGQQLAPPLKQGQQLALANQPQLAHPQRQARPSRIEVGFGMDHDLGAFNQRRWQGVDDQPVTGHLDGHVGELISQGHEDDIAARAPTHLGQLSLDPDHTQTIDPTPDRLDHCSHGGRIVCGSIHAHEQNPMRGVRHRQPTKLGLTWES